MAMYRISNGEPVAYKHHCNSNREGYMMTDEELKDFLVNNLVECYKECGTNAEVINKSSQNNTFWGLLHKAKRKEFTPDIRIYDIFGSDSLNLDIVVTTKSGARDFDASNMIEDYKRTGNLPVLVIGDAWCFDDERGLPKNGGSFATKYEIQSLLPDDNAPLPKLLSQRELAETVMEGWQKLDASIFAPYLDVHMHYNSDGVFHEMSSKVEYMNYIEGKFATLRRNNTAPSTQLCKMQGSDDFSILFRQQSVHPDAIIMRFICKNGRIFGMRMSEIEL